MKDRLLGLEFTWSKFLKELIAKFYPVVVQVERKKVIQLRMGRSITVLQYVIKFTKLTWFIPKFVSTKRLNIRRFEEGLAFYIRNQLAGQPITNLNLPQVICASSQSGASEE